MARKDITYQTGRNCEQCFYATTPCTNPESGETFFECRRFPPPIADADREEDLFPWVAEDSVCGEFKAIETRTAEEMIRDGFHYR